MKKTKSWLVGSSLLLALTIGYQSHGAPSDGGMNTWAQIETEFKAEQNSLWTHYEVVAEPLNYSAESLSQLKHLHNAIRNNSPIQIEQYNQIRIACKKPECQ